MLAPGDFDDDGKDDLLLADGASAVEVLRSAGDGTFARGVPVEAGPGAWGMAVADLDGDGDLDVAVADIQTPVTFTDPGLVSILLGDGAGGLEKARDVPIHSLRPVALAAGDLAPRASTLRCSAS